MLTGFRTLPLLCKTTQMLPADVVQLVRECLRLHVGKRCPAWIDSLFVQQLQGFGMDSEVIFTVCAVRHINLANFHDGAWLNMSSSDNKDEYANVTVKFTIYPGGILWDLECMQNNTLLLQNSGMHLDSQTWQPSILTCLKQSRRSFTRPDTEPCGTLEVPSCLQGWRSFFMLWLFSEAHTPQATLLRWMHAAKHERCATCKKPNAQKRLDAFCSPQCAEAYTTLSCSICRLGPPWYEAK